MESPTVAVCRDGQIRVSGPVAFTVRLEIVCKACCCGELESNASTMKDVTTGVMGVPAMAPVPPLMLMPDGRAPDAIP